MSFLNGYILLFSPAGSRVISVIMCVMPWITLLAWFEHQATPFCKFMVDKMAFRQVFLRELRYSPCQYHPNSAPHSFNPLPLILYILGKRRHRTTNYQVI